MLTTLFILLLALKLGGLAISWLGVLVPVAAMPAFYAVARVRRYVANVRIQRSIDAKIAALATKYGIAKDDVRRVFDGLSGLGPLDVNALKSVMGNGIGTSPSVPGNPLETYADTPEVESPTVRTRPARPGV